VKDNSKYGRDNGDPRRRSMASAVDVEAWFLREVLPLEAALMGYFKRNWRNESDTRDLVQEVYVHACEAAREQLPRTVRPFIFTTARNLLIDKFRNLSVVPLETVGDVETLAAASDQPGPDRSVIARDELRRLQAALDKLSPRCREAVLLKQLEGLSRREVAGRMGISEETVKEYLAIGLFTLSDIFFGQHGEQENSV
jgi:RNA polymerase sigma factor (sigma-70 family)